MFQVETVFYETQQKFICLYRSIKQWVCTVLSSKHNGLLSQIYTSEDQTTSNTLGYWKKGQTMQNHVSSN